MNSNNSNVNSNNGNYMQFGGNGFQNDSNAIQQNIEQIKNWQAQSPEDLQIISQKHEQLLGQILAEEEDVIASHRGHIDDMVELVKQVSIFKKSTLPKSERTINRSLTS